MPYVGEARDGLPNHPVPQKARRAMTNLGTRLKTSSSGHPPQVGTMFPALMQHSQASYTHKHMYLNPLEQINMFSMAKEKEVRVRVILQFDLIRLDICQYLIYILQNK